MGLQEPQDAQGPSETRRHAPNVDTNASFSPDNLTPKTQQDRSFNQSTDPDHNYSLANSPQTANEHGKTHVATTASASPADAPITIPSHRGRSVISARPLTPREKETLRDASELPPVTKASLRELDLPCIMNKLALRIDVNYDRDLHFTPARHGKDNPRKIAADMYWEALATELEIHALGSPYDIKLGESPCQFRSRLPGLFDTIREVLQTLVPARDHDVIKEQLDTDLLLQQIQFKVLDMVALAKWLATLLKTHCAPMRDESADRMAEEIKIGWLDNDTGKIANGLRLLFGVLETMKLDVANHQIRTFRILLIENTVHFLQKRYLKMITEGEKDVQSAALWFEQVRSAAMRPDNFYPDESSNFLILVEAMCNILVSCQDDLLPTTLDEEKGRIQQLRNDLQDLVCLEVCCDILTALLNDQRQSTHTYNVLKARLWYLMDEVDDTVYGSNRWVRNIDSISVEIARAKAIIEPGTGSLSARTIGEAEHHVRHHLANRTPLSEDCSYRITMMLKRETATYASQYLRMSPLEISESQRGSLGSQHATESQPYADIHSIARRLAHVAVLHWWVWAPLVYQRNLEADERGEDSNPTG